MRPLTPMARSLAGTTGLLLALAGSPVRAPAETGCRDPAHAAGPAGLEGVCRLVEEGRFDEAAEQGRRLLARIERSPGPESVEAARVLDLLTEAIRRGGGARGPETLELAERAAAIKLAALGPDDPELATSLHNVATTLFVNDRPDEARPLFERALAIREKGLGPDHPLVAQSLNYLGSLLADLGQDDAALSALRRGLEIRERVLGPEHRDVAWSLNSLANLLDKRGDYDEARALYERALALREAALRPDHPYVAISQNNLARLLTTIGDYAGARTLYERAVAIRERSDAELPGTLILLGELLMRTGDYAEAQRLLERSRDILIAEEGPDDPAVVWALDDLARLSLAGGRLDEAKRLLDRGLRVREIALGPDHRYVAYSLHELARWHLLRGDHGSAARVLGRAVRIEERYLGPEHPDVAEGLFTRADLLRAAGQPREALPLYERALRIQERSIGSEHPDVARTLEHRALALEELGRVDQALDSALRAEAISRDHLLLTGRFLAERQVLGYAESRTRGLDLAVRQAVDSEDAAARQRVADAMIRSRALVFDELAARNHALDPARDPDVAPLVERLRRASTRFSNLRVRGVEGDSPANYRSRLREARMERERAERALAEKSLAFRRDRVSSRIGLGEVMQSLPPDGVLVSFVLHDATDGGSGDARRYTAVLQGAAAAPVFVDLGPAREIDGQVGRWREETATGLLRRGADPAAALAASRREGRLLRRRIWDPLARHLNDVGRIFVVPDGSLQLVSLAAMPDGDTGYLIESAPPIHYLTAERDLVQAAPRHGRGFLALGDPAFDGSLVSRPGTGFRGAQPSCGGFASLRFTALPATGQEIRRIAALWAEQEGTEAVVFEGEAASEAAFKSRAPGKRILHLATHGFFLAAGCGPSASGLRGIGGLTSPGLAGQGPAESPLQLSGLALAGANRRGEAPIGSEDGILTSDEIAALDLNGVEWAVLSACETGVGEISAGEGVFGLRRAFQTAGAGTVIMSLWSVDDPNTLRWMTALYEARLRDKLGTADAVREASLRLLRSDRERPGGGHPFYWASFIAVGDWR